MKERGPILIRNRCYVHLARLPQRCHKPWGPLAHPCCVIHTWGDSRSFVPWVKATADYRSAEEAFSKPTGASLKSLTTQSHIKDKCGQLPQAPTSPGHRSVADMCLLYLEEWGRGGICSNSHLSASDKTNCFK